MEQFDQLLTCAICLDKFRNPKLLPCQHSYCLECLENLVDYVRKQVKCPECRSCHSLHYNGVQAFPTNVTIQRFLELHLEITGELPDPTTNQIMERCQVCSEKAYLSPCAHCEKRVCPDCKEGHMEVLKREINRISNQVRRVLHRLDDSLTSCEKNSIQLQSNMMTIMEEIDDVCRRVTKAIKDRADNLKYEIEKYGTGEIKNLMTLRSNIEQELSNIKSNCELVEKYITPTETNGTWQDNELMDTKDIFLKTMEFIRNFECESGDFGRRIRFTMNIEPNTLVLQLSTLGDLILPNYNSNSNNSNNNNPNSLGSLPSSQSGLMRSKSDHRLTTQFRQQQDYDDPACGRTSPVLGVGRKFGERRSYGDTDQEPERKSSRFRSRFTRHLDAAFEDSPAVESSRGVRFEAEKKERERVLDTEDVTRGPLSGVTRLNDSPIVLQRIQESEYPKPIKPAPEKVVAPAIVQAAQLPHLAPWRLSRQTSEEDEVTKQKKQNKQAEAAETASKRAPSIARRVSNEPRSPQERNPSRGASQEVSSEPPPQPEPVRPTTRKLSPEKFPKVRSESSDSGSSESSTSSSRSTGAVFTTDELKNRFLTKSEPEKPAAAARSRYAGSATASSAKPVVSRTTPAAAESKSSSEESTEEEESSDEEEPKTPAESTKGQARMAKTDIGPLLARSAVAREPIGPSSATARSALAERETPRERDLPPRDYRERDPPPRDPYRKREPSPPSSHSLSAYRRNREAARMTSPPSRENYGSSTTSTNSRYGLSDYPTGSSNLARSRTGTSLYPGDSPSLASKYSALNRSRHSFDEPDSTTSRSSYAAGDSMDKGTRLSNLRDRRARIARSKSSHDVLAGLDPEEAEQLGLEDPNEYIRARRKSTTTPDSESLSSWAKYLKNKYGKGSSGISHDEPLETTRRSPKLMSSFSNPYSSKKRLLFKFGSRGSGPGEFTWPRGVATGPEGIIAVADSSNHRIQVFDQHGNYMKEIGTYGNGDGEFDCLAGVAINRIGQFIVSDRYNHRIQIFDPSGNFLRAFGSQGTSDGKFNYPWGICTDALGFIYVCDKENSRIQVFQSDGTFVGKFGEQGRGVGFLDHPHYIAVTTTNRVVVSDSNNHRIQTFDVNGRLLSSFGTEGCDEMSFKLPRGIAVDGNNIIIGDSGNNRIQIFTQDGQFLKSIGNWGCGDLEFKGMEGISISSNGNIIVADRENHRIQVL